MKKPKLLYNIVQFKVLMVINERMKKVVSSSWLRSHWAVHGFLHGSLKMDRSPTSPDHRHNLTGFDCVFNQSFLFDIYVAALLFQFRLLY